MARITLYKIQGRQTASTVNEQQMYIFRSEHIHRNESLSHGKLNGTILHQKLSICLKSTGRIPVVSMTERKSLMKILVPLKLTRTETNFSAYKGALI